MKAHPQGGRTLCYGYFRTDAASIGSCASLLSTPNARRTPRSRVCSCIPRSTNIEFDINPADLRIDTYRASGAGGQHVNKTDSASHHAPAHEHLSRRRTTARNTAPRRGHDDDEGAALRAGGAQAERPKQKLEDTKTDIGWGHQIRSYVLDQSRIKDLRTNVEVGNTQSILDGDLDLFITASLKQGV